MFTVLQLNNKLNWGLTRGEISYLGRKMHDKFKEKYGKFNTCFQIENKYPAKSYDDCDQYIAIELFDELYKFEKIKNSKDWVQEQLIGIEDSDGSKYDALVEQYEKMESWKSVCCMCNQEIEDGEGEYDIINCEAFCHDCTTCVHCCETIDNFTNPYMDDGRIYCQNCADEGWDVHDRRDLID